MRTKLFTVCALVAGTAPLCAQAPATPVNAPLLGISERIRLASLLPVRTAEVRDAGVPDSTISRILDIFRARQIDPVQADEILVAERDAAREHGPTDNFGDFVQRQLASGKRGRALSDAIRAEHRAHGRRNGNDKDKTPHQDKGQPKLRHDAPPGQGQSGRDRRPN